MKYWIKLLFFDSVDNLKNQQDDSYQVNTDNQMAYSNCFTHESAFHSTRTRPEYRSSYVPIE